MKFTPILYPILPNSHFKRRKHSNLASALIYVWRGSGKIFQNCSCERDRRCLGRAHHDITPGRTKLTAAEPPKQILQFLAPGGCDLQGYHMIWVNYNELTTSSLEIIVSKGNHPLLWP